MKLSSSQQIKYGAILSYIGVFVYILIGLLYTPWMIRSIGKEDYGLYTLAYSILSFFVFDFGISAAIQRFVSKYLAEGKEEEVNKCVSTVYKLYLYIDCFILAILLIIFFLIPTIYRELTPDQIIRLKIVFAMVSTFSVISFPFIPLNGILSAYEEFVQLKSCDLFSKVLTVLVNVLCLYYGGGLYEIVLGNIIVGALFIVVKYVIVKRTTNLSIQLNYKSSRRELKELLLFSGWTTVVAICQRFIINISPSILGYFAGVEVIAVFGIALCLEAHTYNCAYAMNGMFLPKVSRLLSQNESVLPLMIRVGRIQLVILGLIMVGFLIVGKQFIFAWLGDGYENAYYCTILLITPAFFLLPADIADQTLIASGNVKLRAYAYLITAVVNIVLSIILTSLFGIIGLAASIFISLMIRNAALYYVYYKKLNINVFIFFRDVYLKMSLGLITSLVVSYILAEFVPFQGWLDVVVRGAITILTYAIVMLILALNESERKLFFSILRRK